MDRQIANANPAMALTAKTILLPSDKFAVQDSAGAAEAQAVTIQQILDLNQPIIGYVTENVNNKSNDASLASNSPTLYPTVHAAKTYTDGLVVGLLSDRGNYNASVNTFPVTGGRGSSGIPVKGDLWYISTGGILGGTAVAIGYSIRALIDTPGQTAGNWGILNVGLGYTPENSANKSTSISADTGSVTKYPTVKAVQDAMALTSSPQVKTISFGEFTIPHTLGTANAKYGIDLSSVTPASGFLDGNSNIVLTPSAAVFNSLRTAAKGLKLRVFTNIVKNDINSAFDPSSNGITIELITVMKNSSSGMSSIISVFQQFTDDTGGFVDFSKINTATLNSPVQIGDTGTFYSETDFTTTGEDMNLGIGGAFSSAYFAFAAYIAAPVDTKDYKFKFEIDFTD